MESKSRLYTSMCKVFDEIHISNYNGVLNNNLKNYLLHIKIAEIKLSTHMGVTTDSAGYILDFFNSDLFKYMATYGIKLKITFEPIHKIKLPCVPSNVSFSLDCIDISKEEYCALPYYLNSIPIQYVTVSHIDNRSIIPLDLQVVINDTPDSFGCTHYIILNAEKNCLQFEDSNTEVTYLNKDNISTFLIGGLYSCYKSYLETLKVVDPNCWEHLSTLVFNNNPGVLTDFFSTSFKDYLIHLGLPYNNNTFILKGKGVLLEKSF